MTETKNPPDKAKGKIQKTLALSVKKDAVDETGPSFYSMVMKHVFISSIKLLAEID